jgi:predicted O-methyltransferase YrrM
MEKGVKRFSLKYLKYKCNLLMFRAFNKNAPWWNKDAIKIAKNLLRPGDDVLEFGCGRSTVWLAERCNHIISIEHDKGWYTRIDTEIKKRNISNTVCLKYLPILDNKPNDEQPYLDPLQIQNKSGYDVVLIDGKLRGFTALNALPILKKNGILIIDDVHRYLPRNWQKDRQLVTAEEWRQVAVILEHWRELRTTDGYHETSFYFR